MSYDRAEKELADAVYKGDVELVMRVLHEMDINSMPLPGSPLHLAAERGHVGVADVLLKAGVDVDSRNEYDDTPLHMAAEWGQFGVVELLLNAGAEMHSRNRYGVTPFRMATLRRHDRVAELLKPETPVGSEDQAWDPSPVQVSLPKGRPKGDPSFRIGPEGGKLQTTSCTVILPPGAVTMETNITCKVVNPNDITVPLTDGDMLVSDIIELGPHGTTLHKPVTVRMQYCRTGGDRELVVRAIEDMSQGRELKTTEKDKENIAVTLDQFSTLAVISTLKQDQFSVSTEGCTLTSSTQPAVLITFPEQSVNVSIQVKLQVQEISKHVLDEMKAKDQSSRSLVCASPIVKIEAADQSSVQFNKPVTVQVPHPRHYMGVSEESATKLHVTSCEEGTDEWTDVTDDVSIRDLGEFVEFNVTKTASHIILDVQIGDESEEIGPIPLALCKWIHQHDTQFTLLQREDNPKHIIIECSKASDADDRVTRVGYKAPVPSDIVRLCEGQKVEVNVEGNVSFADLGTTAFAERHITFHSQVRCNRLPLVVMGEKDKGLRDLDGEGIVTFHALPRIALGLSARGGRRARSALKKKQEPEEHPSSIFLCKLPINVLMTRQLEDQLQEGASSPEPKGMAKYIYFVKEEVSTNWMDLAHFLGFTCADIQNIVSLKCDSKTSCWFLLGKWQKREGDAATIQVLMEALSEAKLQSVVDGLRKKFPEIQEEVGVKK